MTHNYNNVCVYIYIYIYVRISYVSSAGGREDADHAQHPEDAGELQHAHRAQEAQLHLLFACLFGENTRRPTRHPGSDTLSCTFSGSPPLGDGDARAYPSIRPSTHPYSAVRSLAVPQSRIRPTNHLKVTWTSRLCHLRVIVVPILIFGSPFWGR